MAIVLSSLGFILCFIVALLCWGVSLFFFGMTFWTSHTWRTLETGLGVMMFVIGIVLMVLGFHFSPFELNLSAHMRY